MPQFNELYWNLNLMNLILFLFLIFLNLNMKYLFKKNLKLMFFSKFKLHL